MPYVKRDEEGHVIGLFAASQESGQEFLPDDHPDVIAFRDRTRRRQIPAISDRQFFQALAMKGLVSKDEALAAVQTGAIPNALAVFLAQIKDPDEHFAALMLLSGATQFERHHPLVDNFGHEAGLTDQELDDLWRSAASL